MLFEMQLGKRIFDLVIQLLFLDKPYFAFTRAYRIARSGNGSRFHEAPGSFRGGYQDAALSAYLIRRHRPSISASFIGTCRRKHSNAADIRYGSLSDGRERMYDSTLMSVPSKNTFFNSSVMVFSLQYLNQEIEKPHSPSPFTIPRPSDVRPYSSR